MRIVNELNTYISIKDKYSKVINEQILIIGQSGSGKGLAIEGIAEKFKEEGYIVITISDPKRECEFAYQMFEPRERYHLDFLRRVNKRPGSQKVKLYHPFTFNMPKENLPPMNIYTIPIKELGEKEWRVLTESQTYNETLKSLLNTTESLPKNNGLYDFMSILHKSIKINKGKESSFDISNFGISDSGAGNAKTISEVINLLKPFQKDYFLQSQDCKHNLNWKEILSDNKNTHVFLYHWISHEKYRDFLTLYCLESIVRYKDFAKHPVLIILDEIGNVAKYKPEGHKKILSDVVRSDLSMIRATGKGMSSILANTTYTDISEEIRNASTVTLFGEIGGGSDLDGITKKYGYKTDVKEQLRKPDYQYSFLLKGKEELGQFTIFYPKSRHAEPHTNFFETYRKEMPDKLHSFKELHQEMKQRIKEEQDKVREGYIRKKKREKEEKLKKEKEKGDKTKELDIKKKDIKIKQLKDMNKLEKMKRCWEFHKENPQLSDRESARQLGLAEGSGHKTYRKYVNEFHKRRQEQKEREKNKDFEEKILKDLE